MTTFKAMWQKLGKGRKYREELVASQLKRGIPFQIRALMKQRGWSQEDLGSHASLSQGVVSRAANPNYGNLTLNTIIRIAAGFDVAFVGRFVPFSELSRWYINLTEETISVPTFEEESAAIREKEERADLLSAWVFHGQASWADGLKPEVLATAQGQSAHEHWWAYKTPEGEISLAALLGARSEPAAAGIQNTSAPPAVAEAIQGTQNAPSRPPTTTDATRGRTRHRRPAVPERKPKRGLNARRTNFAVASSLPRAA